MCFSPSNNGQSRHSLSASVHLPLNFGLQPPPNCSLAHEKSIRSEQYKGKSLSPDQIYQLALPEYACVPRCFNSDYTLRTEGYPPSLDRIGCRPTEVGLDISPLFFLILVLASNEEILSG